jgi:hypothetical protein
MINITKYKKFVSRYLWVHTFKKNESMPIIIMKLIFHTKKEKKRGTCEKIHMLFNTLYGLHQQIPQLNIDISFFWWAFEACVLWFSSNSIDAHDSNRPCSWRYVIFLHIDQECPTHAQLVINQTTLLVIPIHQYSSAVKRLGFVLRCVVECYLVKIW